MAAPWITPAMCARGRVLGEPRLSPTGDSVAFVANVEGRGQLVLVPAGGGAEVVLTADPAPRPVQSYGGGAFDWSPDGRWLVFAGADGRLHEIPVTGGPTRAITDPDATPRGPSSPAVSPDGTAVAFLVDGHHVAVARREGEGGAWGWPARLSTGADFCLDPVWSPDGRLVAWHEWDVPAMPWDASRIVVRPADGSGPPSVVAGGDGVATAQPRWSPDGSMLAFLCDAGGFLNLWVADGDGTGARPLLDEPFEHGDPAWGPGQRSFAWSPDSTTIAFCRNEEGFGRLCRLDVASGAIDDVGRGAHGALSWVGDTLAAIRSGARTPTQVVAYRGSERTTLARGPVAGFEAADLPEPEVVHWPGDDGEVVHGRLYRPNRQPPEGLEQPPLLLLVHGGPTGQTTVAFNHRIAYWVDRGWLVLVPDHRGSTGWGRAYTQAMSGRWGELDVSDCAAGLRAAAERGWCDPTRMVPMGGSAGGFTVLLLLANHPELCAAGVDLYGVADLLDLDETTHRFEAHYLHSIVGALPGCADRYRDRSPVNLADRIRSPLLILQGSDDPVVPPAQSEAIAAAVRRRGGVVEHHVYEGEGHGWLRPEHVEDELVRVESFLRRHVLRWR